jgi:arylmalonate decarboxylase-like protein
MSKPSPTKLGWLGPSPASSSHLRRVRSFIPADVEIVYEQLVLHDGRLADLEGKLDTIVTKAIELTEKHRWDGLIFPGAPREVLNPQLFARFSSALQIPVATALRSSVAALHALAVGNVLLLTPFDESLNKLIRDFLAGFRIRAFSPRYTLGHYTDALKLSSEDVAGLARQAIAERPDVDGVYFQGAVLDPIDVLDPIENEFKIPVIASNPAMFWFMLSRLGRRDQITGFGNLLSTWPEIQ